MILTKQDLSYYLYEDRKAQNKNLHPSFKQKIIEFFYPDSNFEFVKNLRYYEFF